MPYRFRDDIATADAAFEAWGTTREEMFRAAADALMNIMVEDLSTILDKRDLIFSLTDTDLELLLFNFLQEFLFQKDAYRLLLRVTALELTQRETGITLTAHVSGEAADQQRHPFLIDVKAVTLHHFQITQTTDSWRATVIVDT